MQSLVFQMIAFFNCGAGGSRTLVQKRKLLAFYVFILQLIVGIKPATSSLFKT